MKTDKPVRTYLHNILYYNIILYGPVAGRRHRVFMGRLVCVYYTYIGIYAIHSYVYTMSRYYFGS